MTTKIDKQLEADNALIADALAAIKELELREETEIKQIEAESLSNVNSAVSTMNEQEATEAEILATTKKEEKAIEKKIAKDLANKDTLRNKDVATMRATSVQAVRIRRVLIKRKLIDEGNVTLLTLIVPKYIKKKIIPFKTQQMVQSVAKYRELINKRIANCMSPLFPEKIRVARAMCGSRPFKEHPGFLWKTPESYGNYSVWVRPDIPYFFDQFTEMQIIREKCDINKVNAIDAAIQFYMLSIEKLSRREANLAIKLTRLDTFGDILNFDVDTFIYIYDLYKKAQEEEARLLRDAGEEVLAEKAEEHIVDIDIENEMEAFYAIKAKESKGYATDKK